MIYFKLLVVSAFLFQLALAHRDVKPGRGFGRFLSCFRPQVVEKEVIEPVEEYVDAAESDIDAIADTIESIPKKKTYRPDFDLEKEFARWLPRFKKRSEYITWSNASPKASKRIAREMQALMEEQNNARRKDLDFLVYVNEDNFYHWMVKFINFQKLNPKERITLDMKKMGIDEMVAEVIFTSNYPQDPPLIRVLGPEMMSSYHGIFCATLFTHGPEEQGHWRSSLSMSSVLTQFRHMFFDLGIGLPHRKDPFNFEYGLQKALGQYSDLLRNTHSKWGVPVGLQTELKQIKA